MSAHPLQWQSPQPLWHRFGGVATAADQQRPAILRFATDDFMEQALGTLAREPAQIGRLVARPETWRKPMSDAADLTERLPMPRIAQTGARRVTALRAKVDVAQTVSQASVIEQSIARVIPLKLYQPAHQRFYLVSASLVCGLTGFPERAVTAGGPEQVNVVIRRLVPRLPKTGDFAAPLEFAFVKDAQGARWMRVGEHEGHDPAVTQLAAGEELLPTFPLRFADDGGKPRTLWSSMIPVGRREEYLGANVDRAQVATLAAGQRAAVLPAPAQAAVRSTQARVSQFKLEVAEPWKNLIRTAFVNGATLRELPADGLDGGETEAAKAKRAFDFNLQQQTASWLILLDFADYLAAWLPDVWQAIFDDGASAGALADRRLELYNWLGSVTMPVGLKDALKRPVVHTQVKTPSASMRAALKAIRVDSVRNALEQSTELYTADNSGDAQWPNFHFVLAGLDTGRFAAGPFEQLNALGAQAADQDEDDPLPGLPPQFAAAQLAAEKLDRLTALVGRALEPNSEAGAPPPPFALQVRNAMAASAADPGWFVIRFVYTRRDCGPLHPPVVSAPSQQFQLANFFDPDAPARPIRITLPLDTSPAALRKYNRNTAFVISDMLCGQIQRAKGMGLIDLVRSVLPWPLHKDLDAGGGSCRSGEINIGMICSLSIPIITICALILLIIIVTLFDMIFRWLPYFIMCFPVPGLKGKKDL